MSNVEKESSWGVSPFSGARMEIRLQTHQEVTIRIIENGFIVRVVGCKEFSANNWADVSAGLSLYWEDPEAAREKYCAKRDR